MRNFIAHQYENVDLDFIFSTATQDIPKLKQALETLEKELKKEALSLELESAFLICLLNFQY